MHTPAVVARDDEGEGEKDHDDDNESPLEDNNDKDDWDFESSAQADIDGKDSADDSADNHQSEMDCKHNSEHENATGGKTSDDEGRHEAPWANEDLDELDDFDVNEEEAECKQDVNEHTGIVE